MAVAVRARITLEMRCVVDCERFGSGFVGKGQWRRVGGYEEDGASGRKGGLYRRRCESCGDETADVRITERNEGGLFADAWGF